MSENGRQRKTDEESCPLSDTHVRLRINLNQKKFPINIHNFPFLSSETSDLFVAENTLFLDVLKMNQTFCR